MDSLPDWDALQRLTGSISRGAPGYSTNLYASREQVDRWGGAGQLRVLADDGVVLVLRADRDFHHVYHVAHDLPALSAALAGLPPGHYATDLIGRDDALERACAAYGASGFATHAFLRRMVRGRTSGAVPAGDGARLAGPDDAEEVAAFLERLLDRFTEQLPDTGELREAAGDGRLLIVREGDVLAGMLMYDRTGQLAHLRFWHVDADGRGRGVGRRLMSSFLSRCVDAARIVLWVIGDNDRSIAIYRHYGFETDGLLDRVMTLHKEQR